MRLVSNLHLWSQRVARVAGRPGLLLSLVLALVAGLPADLFACVVTNRPPTVQICPLPNCRARIIISGYSTFPAAPNSMFCACAFKQVPSIVSIDNALVVNCRNCQEGGSVFGVSNCCGGAFLSPFSGFNNGGANGFNLNAITANFFQGAQGGNWGGFFSSVYQNIPANTCVDLVFEVTLASPCSPNQLRNELAAGGLVASSAADSTGLPIEPGGHLSYVALPLSSITIAPTFVDEVYFGTSDCPPPGSSYASSPIAPVISFGTLAQARDFVHGELPNPIPLPALGAQATYAAQTTKISARFSLDGGNTYVGGSAPASVNIRITRTTDQGGTSYFDTEMLALDIGGGNLPAGAMLRESPTKVSAGKHTARTSGSGFLISSFFDVNLELSADGGQNWIPASGPVRVELRTSNPIPTVSQWGLIILSLLLLTVGTVFLLRRRVSATTGAAA